MVELRVNVLLGVLEYPPWWGGYRSAFNRWNSRRVPWPLDLTYSPTANEYAEFSATTELNFTYRQDGMYHILTFPTDKDRTVFIERFHICFGDWYEKYQTAPKRAP